MFDIDRGCRLGARHIMTACECSKCKCMVFLMHRAALQVCATVQRHVFDRCGINGAHRSKHRGAGEQEKSSRGSRAWCFTNQISVNIRFAATP